MTDRIAEDFSALAFDHGRSAESDSDDDSETDASMSRLHIHETIDVCNAFAPLSYVMENDEPEMWDNALSGFYADVPSTIANVCRGIRNSEHARRARPGFLRLNGTLPDAPETSKNLGLQTVERSDQDKAVEGGDNVGKVRTKEIAAAASKQKRLKHVLERVTNRLSNAGDVNAAIFSWLVLSSATPAWKLAVFKNICRSELLDFDSSKLNLNAVKGLILLSSKRYRKRTLPEEMRAISEFENQFRSRDYTCAVNIKQLECFDADSYAWCSTSYTLYSGEHPDLDSYDRRIGAFITYEKVVKNNTDTNEQ